MTYLNDYYTDAVNRVWRNRLGDFNSTLSLGLVRMLFQGVMDMSDFLSIDKTRQSRWQDILEKLSEYPLGITEDGRQSLKNMEKGPQDKEGYCSCKRTE